MMLFVREGKKSKRQTYKSCGYDHEMEKMLLLMNLLFVAALVLVIYQHCCNVNSPTYKTETKNVREQKKTYLLISYKTWTCT